MPLLPLACTVTINKDLTILSERLIVLIDHLNIWQPVTYIRKKTFSETLQQTATIMALTEIHMGILRE